MPKAEMDANTREWLLAHASGRFPLGNQTYTVEGVAGHGFLGVVLKVRDTYNRPRAAKMTVYADFEGKSYRTELERSALLEQHAVFTRVHDAGVVDLEINGIVERFMCFIEDWVDGRTLKSLISADENWRVLTPSFLLSFVEQMCQVLAALEAVGLRHDDMHAGNVMISPPTQGSLSDEARVRIVDMGSLKEYRAPLLKQYNDHQSLVLQLIEIRNVLARSPQLGAAGRRFIREIDRIVRSMADSDSTIALRDPSQIAREFYAAWTKSLTTQTAALPDMRSPFDYISAEHIADDRLLERIFAESCPWLPLINTQDPCLVTGPRGCGKSTILRWLSLKTHLHRDDAHLQSLKLTGFYISCSAELQNRLGWIDSDQLAERHRAGIIHYFNLLALREITISLLLLCEREDRETVWAFGRSQENAFYDYVIKHFPNQTYRLQGVPRLRQLQDLVDREIFDVHQSMLRRSNVNLVCTPETFLGDLSSHLATLIPRFAERRIAFLIDDFSIHRVPEPVQKVLNSVIWERRSSHIFKLSSEKLGAVLVDVRNGSADLTREMTEVDCGKEFLLLEQAPGGKSKAQRFATELLEHRMQAASFRGDPRVLFGPSAWPEGSLGKALASKRKGRREDQYHGIKVISSLCSGDVSSLLYVYRKVFQLASVTPEYVSTIPPHIQHRAIREVSRKLIDGVQLTHPLGSKCYSVLNAFGALVKLILNHGKWQVDAAGARQPSQAPRIELDRRHLNDELSGEPEELRKELLRRAIFIDLDAGTSRHGASATMRWHLRRIYLPQFGASIAKNDAVKEGYDWLKYLLTDPDRACESVWTRWPKEKASKQVRSAQQSLGL